MKRKWLLLGLLLVLLAGLLAGCGDKSADGTTTPAVPEEPVVLTIVGSWEDCRAIDVVGTAFTAKYPNCTVVYEQLQNFEQTIGTRLAGARADLFFTTKLQEGDELQPCALDLRDLEGLDLSDTFPGLIENFTCLAADGTTKQLFTLPLGADVRGMCVNITLLKSVGINTVPTDQASFLEACRILKENGYTPLQGNPGDFAQWLLYPWACNQIANAEDYTATYERVKNGDKGVSELFTEPFAFLYSLIENDYYDYKSAQKTEWKLFTDTTDADYARYLLNIGKAADGETLVKLDGAGQVAFMPLPLSKLAAIDKMKEDYHSEIEYSFILAPIGVDGGYAYMSPGHGISINRNGENIDWSIRFLDFLFESANNKAFAEAYHVIPNTKDAFSYVTELYDIPDNHVSHIGEVIFDNFFDLFRTTATKISKGNNPSYMQGEGENKTMYPLTYYTDEFRNSLEGNPTGQ